MSAENTREKKHHKVSPKAQADIAAAMNLYVDQKGHFDWQAGYNFERRIEHPTGRYYGLKLIGSGTYGKVVKCFDRKHQANVAIKVVRNAIEYKAAAQREIFILNDLNGIRNTAKLLRDFQENGHICMVFDLYGESLASLSRQW